MSMNQKFESEGKRLKPLEVAWLCAITLTAFLGLSLIIYGTGASTAGRHLVPPEILPGLGVLYICAALVAVITAKDGNSTSFLVMLRRIVIEKIGEAGRVTQRNMFLLLTLCLVGPAMTYGVTPMYRVFATNYVASLFANLLMSMLAAIGLFGWLCSVLISKQSKEKS